MLRQLFTFWNNKTAQWCSSPPATLPTVKLCPGCNAPIEKNRGCDHMHCPICGIYFSWKQARPLNLAALDNAGDGRFRLCPYCNYQNEKLHSLSDVRCCNCSRDFNWDSALFVPVVVQRGEGIQRNVQGSGSQHDHIECRALRRRPVRANKAVRDWLKDHRRSENARGDSKNITAEHNNKDNPFEVTNLERRLLCDICLTNERSHVLECGHLFCEECLVQILKQNPECPMDRRPVKSAPIRVFL